MIRDNSILNRTFFVKFIYEQRNQMFKMARRTGTSFENSTRFVTRGQKVPGDFPGGRADVLRQAQDASAPQSPLLGDNRGVIDKTFCHIGFKPIRS
jgi:hypothetical protein